MKRNLALELRPKRLSEMIGQDAVVKALRAKMSKRPARALMFHGPSGVGKTTLARIVALSEQLNLKQWGEPTDEDWEAYNQYAILETNASEVNGVEDARNMVEFARHRPLPPSTCKVFILDEAQLLTSQAQNVLLKPMEDAPEHVRWIICTTDPRKILAPLKQRCAAATYHLKPLDSKGIVKLLQHGAKHIAMGKELSSGLKRLAQELISQDVRAPRAVLNALELFSQGLSPSAAVSGIRAEVDTLGLFRAITKGNWARAAEQLREMDPSEAVWVRAAAAGWFKSCLLRASNPTEGRRFANALRVLTQPVPLEQSLLFPWLISTLYRIAHNQW